MYKNADLRFGSRWQVMDEELINGKIVDGKHRVIEDELMQDVIRPHQVSNNSLSITT